MTKVNLESLFIFIRNGKSVRQQADAGGIPVSRIETISEGMVNPSRVGYAGIELNDARDWLLQDGDILFSHINSVEHVGKCAIYEGHPSRLVHGMNLLCLRPSPVKLWPKFGLYLLRSQGFRSKLSNYINKAVNQASVSTTNLKQIEVCVPSLAEQRRIAAILDQADALRTKRRQALALLDSLGTAIFMDMFPDLGNTERSIRLDGLVELGDSICYGVVQPGGDFPGGVPLVRAGDFQLGVLMAAKLKTIDPQIESTYKRSRLKGYEVILSCVGNVGVAALTDKTTAGFNIARAVARIPYDRRRVKGVFLLHYLRTVQMQGYFTAETRTVAQPTLNIKQLCEAKVHLPPIEAQDRFVAAMRIVQKTSKFLQASLDGVEGMFSSLQHRAFRGEL